MNTPGYEQWGKSRVETSDGRRGTLTFGKDDAGRREGFQWWTFLPDGSNAPENMMIVKMWRGEPQHENGGAWEGSPWMTLKSVGGHLFTHRSL